MKKLILTGILALSLVLVTACGGNGNEDSEGKAVLTGFAVISSVENSQSAGTEDGLAQVDSTAVGVLVDEDGVITKCVIDAAQTKIEFDSNGKILTPLDETFATKAELGDEYGLKEKSGIGKEWNEQIAALCDYVEGKTLEEVQGISLDEETAPTDEELASSVTIKIGGYLDGIEKAVNQAEDKGAKQGDALGLGIVTNIGSSKNAAAAESGLAQVDSTYTLISIDDEETVTGCILDSSQCKVEFDGKGRITSDLTAKLKTKDELGDEYGMKEKSEIGKEWYEQAGAYADYVVGKTEEEVMGISVNKEDVPTDSDLTSTVTISIKNFNDAISKAFETAS